MGLQRCVNCFFTRKLSKSAKTLQVVKPLIIDVHILQCFLWPSLPGDYRVTDEALLAETT